MTHEKQDHMIDAIEAAMDSVHDMDVTLRDYASAVAAALPDMVQPMVWINRQSESGLLNYRIHIGYGLMNGIFELTCNGSTVGEFGSEQDAMDFAQAHHRARIMAALGLTL